MRHQTISLRRRHMIIAGLAGVAAPGAIFAGQCGVTPREAAPAAEVSAGGEHMLVVSGRILTANCKPLAGATIEMWHAGPGTERVSAITDADGRFFAALTPARHTSRPRSIHYRVSHEQRGTLERRLYLVRENGVSHDLVSHLQRDDAGVWRASFGVTLA